MPSGSPELHAKWGSDANAIAFLQDAGYVLLPKSYCWVAPHDHVPTTEELEAIKYLVYEWDYGGLIESEKEGLPEPKVVNWQFLYEPGAKAVCIKDDPPMEGFGRKIKKGEVVPVDSVCWKDGKYTIAVKEELAFYDLEGWFEPYTAFDKQEPSVAHYEGSQPTKGVAKMSNPEAPEAGGEAPKGEQSFVDTLTPSDAKKYLGALEQAAKIGGVAVEKMCELKGVSYAELKAKADQAVGGEGDPAQGTALGAGLMAETMKGSEPDSYYMVIAKGKGMKLGIRPLAFPVPEDGKVWFYLGFRLRVEVTDPAGSILLANEAFGVKGFKEKGSHASLVGGVKLITMPCAPAEAFKVWQEKMITQGIVEDLVKRCEEAKAEMIATPDQVLEYLNLTYDSAIPNTPMEVPTEFPVKYGISVQPPKKK